MRGRDETAFRAGDAVVIALVVGAALLLLLAVTLGAGNSQNLRVEVWQNGIKIREQALSADAEWTVQGDYTNVIRIRDGKAAIVESDCPGADCVHTGWIGRRGRSIVCLPNRLEVRIVGGGAADEDDVDAVVR